MACFLERLLARRREFSEIRDVLGSMTKTITTVLDSNESSRTANNRIVTYRAWCTA